MQIKRDSIGTYLKQNAASSLERPAEMGRALERPVPFARATRSAPAAPANAPIPGTAERIVVYLRERGSAPTTSIVEDLGLSLDDGLMALERLESFGMVTVDRSAGKATVTLAQ